MVQPTATVRTRTSGIVVFDIPEDLIAFLNVTKMRQAYLLIGIVCLCALAVLPAQAFTINTLAITVGQNGDASVSLQYQLTMFEMAAVFLHIEDPAAELQKAMNANMNRPVSVEQADSSSAALTVSSFATVTNGPGAVTITTPAFSLARAQAAVEKYWFAPLISPDFTPKVTTVTFPDGYTETFNNEISIPTVSHTLT